MLGTVFDALEDVFLLYPCKNDDTKKSLIRTLIATYHVFFYENSTSPSEVLFSDRFYLFDAVR